MDTRILQSTNLLENQELKKKLKMGRQYQFVYQNKSRFVQKVSFEVTGDGVKGFYSKFKEDRKEKFYSFNRNLIKALIGETIRLVIHSELDTLVTLNFQLKGTISNNLQRPIQLKTGLVQKVVAK